MYFFSHNLKFCMTYRSILMWFSLLIMSCMRCLSVWIVLVTLVDTLDLTNFYKIKSENSVFLNFEQCYNDLLLFFTKTCSFLVNYSHFFSKITIHTARILINSSIDLLSVCFFTELVYPMTLSLSWFNGLCFFIIGVS